MSEQYCKRCDQWLPEEAFNRYRERRQWWCRECFRAYFKARGALHLRQVHESTVARRRAARAFVLEFLRDKQCADCGEDDPVVLEFDHVGAKTATVCELVGAGASRDRIAGEISRCEVVCVNCHRRRTYDRLDDQRGPRRPRRLRERNLAFVYEILEASQCVDCGISELAVLEFDHIGPKRASVLYLAWNDYALETIRREVAQCEVRCANCHRRRTAAERGHYRHTATRGPASNLSS